MWASFGEHISMTLDGAAPVAFPRTFRTRHACDYPSLYGAEQHESSGRIDWAVSAPAHKLRQLFTLLWGTSDLSLSDGFCWVGFCAEHLHREPGDSQRNSCWHALLPVRFTTERTHTGKYARHLRGSVPVGLSFQVEIVGPEGVEPSTKRIRAQFQRGNVSWTR